VQQLSAKGLENINSLENERKQELSANTVAFISCRIILKMKLAGAAR
jgi:hypothetical protein